MTTPIFYLQCSDQGRHSPKDLVRLRDNDDGELMRVFGKAHGSRRHPRGQLKPLERRRYKCPICRQERLLRPDTLTKAVNGMRAAGYDCLDISDFPF